MPLAVTPTAALVPAALERACYPWLMPAAKRGPAGHAGRPGVRVAVTMLVVAAGCGKTDVAPSPVDAAPRAPPAGPRILPAVAADSDQLLPDVPAGFTACTRTAFDPRIDETTAAERAAVWQAEAAKSRPALHPVDVRAASGMRDDDHTPENTRPEGVVRFTVPKGEIEMRFPGRLSTIRTARRAVEPVFERTGLGDKAHDFHLAPLGKNARVMIGDGWVYRQTNGLEPGLEVDVFLVQESVEESVRALTKHLEHALAATTCSIEEGSYQRGAYRVSTGTEPDGSATITIAATAGGHCTPRARWEELYAARRLADVTIVMACRAASSPGSKTLCTNALASARLR